MRSLDYQICFSSFGVRLAIICLRPFSRASDALDSYLKLVSGVQMVFLDNVMLGYLCRRN